MSSCMLAYGDTELKWRMSKPLSIPCANILNAFSTCRGQLLREYNLLLFELGSNKEFAVPFSSIRFTTKRIIGRNLVGFVMRRRSIMAGTLSSLWIQTSIRSSSFGWLLIMEFLP